MNVGGREGQTRAEIEGGRQMFVCFWLSQEEKANQTAPEVSKSGILS